MARFKRYYQEGGTMGGEDPVKQIIMMAAQAVQEQDAELALQVCQALVELAQGGAGGEAGGEEGYGEPAGGEEYAEEEPVYGKGGRLIGKFRRY